MTWVACTYGGHQHNSEVEARACDTEELRKREEEYRRQEQERQKK